MNTPATPRLKAIQRTALTMLVVAGVINYIDRATLAVANPLIRQELGLSVEQMGYLLSAFLVAYAFSQLPVGAMVDKGGPRLLLTLGLSLWSLAQVLGGLVNGFWSFLGARVVLGIGEAPMFPTCARVVRDWFSARNRGMATGIFNCSSALGTAIAVPLLTYLMLTFGWRSMFVIMGIAGLVLAFLWGVVYRDPAKAALTPEEHQHLVEDDPPGRLDQLTWREWKLLFRFRTTWGMILGFVGTIYILWVYSAWLPGYLEMERHISVKQTGYAAAIPFACAVIGGLTGGWFVDWLHRRGVTLMNSRKIPAGCALLGAALFTLLAAWVSSNVLAVVFISLAMFLIQFATTCAWALASVATPANCTASLAAIQNFGGYLGGALAPTVTGLIVQRTGSFALALTVAAVIGTVSAIAYFVVVRAPITSAEMDAPNGLRNNLEIETR
jgi:sugar phosphate permease